MKFLIEIFIITYNRADDLSQTLSMLAGNISSRVSKITILNNCSKDNTVKVFEQWKAFIPNLFIITHSCNIGGDANNLRAIELSQSVYTWILCDDDKIFANVMEDVWETLNENYYILISLKVKNRKSPENIGEFLLYHTYTPAAIFNTEFFKLHLKVCYNNIYTMFPQFPAILECRLKYPLYIYYSKNNILETGCKQGYSPFKFWAGWKECCKLITIRRYRKQAHKMFTFKSLIYSFLIERKFRNYKRLKWIIPDWIVNKIYDTYVSYLKNQNRDLIIFDEFR